MGRIELEILGNLGLMVARGTFSFTALPWVHGCFPVAEYFPHSPLPWVFVLIFLPVMFLITVKPQPRLNFTSVFHTESQSFLCGLGFLMLIHLLLLKQCLWGPSCTEYNLTLWKHRRAQPVAEVIQSCHSNCVPGGRVGSRSKYSSVVLWKSNCLRRCPLTHWI